MKQELSQSQKALFDFFMYNPSHSFTIKQIARKTNLTKGVVRAGCDDLLIRNLISRKPFTFKNITGGNSRCFVYNIRQYGPEVSQFLKEKRNFIFLQSA